MTNYVKKIKSISLSSTLL